MSRIKSFIAIRPLVIVVVNNTVERLTSTSPVRLCHADPTPNSRGHRSDHTSLRTRHSDWRSSNTGWSQIRRLSFPKSFLAQSARLCSQACKGTKNNQNTREALEKLSPDLIYIYIYISTLLWFNIDAIQSNIYIHYTQTDWAVSSYTNIRGYLVADSHRTALEHC